MSKMGIMRRTIKCGEIRKEHIGQELTIMGWVAKTRNLGALIFIDLRDISGVMQIVIPQEDMINFQLAASVRTEYVIAVKGTVQNRESVNPNLPTGFAELIVNEFVILDTAETTPIYIRDNDQVSDHIRLKYRYLDLRKSSLQANLKLRSKTGQVIRNTLIDHDFIEIETPFLGKPTPEGARDYLVPSRINPGSFYALPQSPQLMKQMLMVAGMDRYFQIVKCFRDEDLRANRQPEFTQIDMEMSFVDVDDVIAVNEQLVKRIFQEIKNIDLATPFPRMSYQEAMDAYGSDKPDLRFGFTITDITNVVEQSEFQVFSAAATKGDTVRGIHIGKYGSEYSRKKIGKLENLAKTYGAKGLAWIKVSQGEIQSPIQKFLSDNELQNILDAFRAEKEDLILLIADKKSVVLNGLAALRYQIAEEMGLIDDSQYAITWIVDFPLFEYDEEEQRLVAKHHPFTHPVDADIHLLDSAPEKVRAKAYDLVINGDEIGGGSIRINNAQLQNKMFQALSLTEEDVQNKFGFFIEALKYGTPPHGGIAYGFDRLMMLLCNTKNIRDVIAFPKTQSATCLTTGAPSDVTALQLQELHLQTIE